MSQEKFKPHFYFIIKEKGLIPQLKKPLNASEDAQYEMAVEIKKLYPDAEVIHVQVREDDLWLEDLGEYIYKVEAWRKIEEDEKKQRANDAKILEDIKTDFGDKFHKKISEYLKNSYGTGYFEIVENPKGTPQDEMREFGLKEVFINEIGCGGMEGDDWYGDLYIPLPSGKFLKSNYSG